MPLRFVLDDIAESECDTIVYAATAAALSEGAAPAPGVTSEEERRIFAEMGEYPAWVTYANDLYCTYVIHVPCPERKGDGEDEARLKKCWLDCLQLAADHDCRSAAFPLIGAGRYGYSDADAIRIAVEAVGEFLKRRSIDVEL
ncbi:MAG: macro domain-containing protein, partial [Oscillospiraceae bacterium]|nr:macro domain-containing protein [Oscillospiraceae bacterium]